MGLTGRPIKALSAEDVAALLSGEGMGLARAAELNHYPGPRHVLELADSLMLGAEQRAAVDTIFEAVRAEAQRLGREIVAAEAGLDSVFAGGVIREVELETRLGAIAALQGRLRFTHLRAHLATRRILTEHQRRRYDELRGYAGGGEHRHGGP